MEPVVVAESVDGKALLVGECKWTNPEMASVLAARLMDKAHALPMAAGKEIVPVLFLKNEPRDNDVAINILYPSDVIKMAYGE